WVFAPLPLASKQRLDLGHMRADGAAVGVGQLRSGVGHQPPPLSNEPKATAAEISNKKFPGHSKRSPASLAFGVKTPVGVDPFFGAGWTSSTVTGGNLPISIRPRALCPTLTTGFFWFRSALRILCGRLEKFVPLLPQGFGALGRFDEAGRGCSEKKHL